ncbi:MAG: hypothetical protein JKX78_11110 [Alteromonadaceae bacterium]|nr:hypothetical protein [Alteromonadaceae bacterium]
MKLSKLAVVISGGSLLLLTTSAFAAAPTKPVISWMPSQYNSGDSVKTTWNMWWGSNGTSWTLTDNNTQICQGALTPNGQSAQTGSCTNTLAGGSHNIQVNLCNSDGCTSSDSKTITVAGGASNVAPQVTITVPATTAKGSQVSLSATASDSDGTVSSVAFYANNQLISTSTSSPYQAIYLADTVGNITLSAIATDNQGATTTSTSTLQVTACTSCLQPPQVSVTTPVNSKVGNLVTLSATASDVDGTVSQVVLKLDNIVLATLTQVPYQTTWTATAGSHSLVAIATDNDNLSTTSTAATFTPANDSAVSLITPATPQIAWLGDQAITNGKADFNVKWNLWYGENGTSWKLLDNNTEIANGNLTANSPSAQTASVPVSITSAGTHSFVVKLCNSNATQQACSSSNAANVKVTGGGTGGTASASPWDYLDNSEWLARKNAGMKGLNKPYNNNDGKMVASYFVEWGVYGRKFNPKDIPVENLTHLIYGFIPICGKNDSLSGTAKSALTSQCAGKQDYEVVVHDKFAALEKNDLDGTGKWDDPIKGIFAEMYRMKMTYPDLKIIPSVGGWTLSDPLYKIGTDATARAVFVKSIIDFIDTYDFFDGIDIDWEFPGGGGANPALGSTADGAGFATLMEDLRKALNDLGTRKNRTYELMAAVSGGVGKVSEIDWERAIKVMDHVNLMTYDYYGAWSQTYGHQTGLYDTNDLATPIDGFNINDAVNYLTSQRSVPANKLNVGVAMYGRGWTGINGGDANGPFVAGATGGTPISGSSADGFWEKGIVDYKGIEKNQLGGVNGTGANGFKLFWDNTANASYLWNQATGTFITFDTERSAKAKGNYVSSKGLGGIFSWEIDADSGTLLNAMHQGLGHPAK